MVRWNEEMGRWIGGDERITNASLTKQPIDQSINQSMGGRALERVSPPARRCEVKWRGMPHLT